MLEQTFLETMFSRFQWTKNEWLIDDQCFRLSALAVLHPGVPKPGGDGGIYPPNNLTVSPPII